MVGDYCRSTADDSDGCASWRRRSHLNKFSAPLFLWLISLSPWLSAQLSRAKRFGVYRRWRWWLCFADDEKFGELFFFSEGLCGVVAVWRVFGDFSGWRCTSELDVSWFSSKIHLQSDKALGFKNFIWYHIIVPVSENAFTYFLMINIRIVIIFYFIFSII